LAEDTGGPDGVTSNGLATLFGFQLEDGASWQFSTDTGISWQAGSGTGFMLSEGAYANGQVQVRQVDLAGNTSAATQMGGVVVDHTAPTRVAIALNLVEDTGGPDGVTTNGLVRLDGFNLESGASWQFTTNGGATWMQGSDKNFTLAEGGYTQGMVQVRQVDLAGNASAVTQMGGVVVCLASSTFSNAITGTDLMHSHAVI